MEVIVNDNITTTTADKIKVVLEDRRQKAVVGNNWQSVQVQDKYSVAPGTANAIVDFKLPASITTGLMYDIADIRQALLDEIGNREIAVGNTLSYAKEYTDGVQTQTMNEVNVKYMAMPGSGVPGAPEAGDVYAMKSNIADMDITYDTGSGAVTAKFQDLNDTVVHVENQYAEITESITALADQDSALVQKTEELAALAGTSSIRINEDKSAYVGPEVVWDGTTPIQVGTVKHSDTSDGDNNDDSTVKWQYLGGTNGEDGNGWARIAEIGSNVVAASSSMLIDNGDGITGWSTAVSDGVSEFVVNADNFKITNSHNTAQPFTIDASDPDNIHTVFTGKIDFVTAGLGSVANVNGTEITSIKGDSIQTGVITLNSLSADDEDRVASKYSGTIVDSNGMTVWSEGVKRVVIGYN